MKTQFKDLTFLIPTRLDSIDRLVNLRATLRFLKQNFATNIHILEADSFNSKLIEDLLTADIEYTFVEDHDPIFFRTYYINRMVKVCKTTFLSVWDTDIVLKPQQIRDSLYLLRTGNADFVYPYEKKFLDTSRIIREIYIYSNDMEILEKHQGKMKRLYPPNPVGGAFLANREKYIESGIENLNYYGWGVEDGERITRWKGLGYKVERINGNLYHLTHSRGLNSSFHTKDQRVLKVRELNRVRSLTKDELKDEVEKWEK